jgi:hypothetical protein
MHDSLQKLVNARDVAHATHSRLDPNRLVLPSRSVSTRRRICIACHEPVSERVEHYKEAVEGFPICGCRLAGGYCHSVTTCPKCGGQLAELRS